MHEFKVVVKKYKRRIFATMVDVFFSLIFWFFFGIFIVKINLISMLWVFNSPGEITALVLTPFIWSFFDFFFDKTPGKYFFHLIVIHKNNNKFQNCILRNYLKLISILIFPLLFHFLKHPKMRGIHEIYSHTRVKSISNIKKK